MPKQACLFYLESMETIENPFKGKVEDALWQELVGKDPAAAVSFSAMAPWQGNTVIFSTNPLAEVNPTDKESKGNNAKWREQQVACWELFRSFGPINAAISSKADSVAGSGFDAYSDNLEIKAFLKELLYGHHNRIDMRATGWMIRMLAEVETFLLLSIEEPPKIKGKRKSPLIPEKPRITIRTLEPSRVGEGSETGLILNPYDSTQTLFYNYKSSAGDEIIPDINIAYNPDLEKLVTTKLGDGSKLKNSKGSGPLYKDIKYRRFIIHWKNLTGILEYERDTPAIASVLEFANLYKNAVKWDLDFKKAQSAYALVFKFDDTPAGKILGRLWEVMTDEEKKKTGLTNPLKPGDRLFLKPGMSLEVKSPQLQKLSGSNQDLIDLVGAGARTPMDLFQGQASGMPYAQVKASRSPLEMEIDNLQWKFGNFFKYSLLRACFYIESVINNFPDTFQTTDISEMVDGKPKEETVNVEPIELVNLTFPLIKFESDPLQKVQAYLGTQNGGMRQIGMSEEDIFKSMGVRDYSRQKRKKILEEMQYGAPQQYNEAAVQKQLKTATPDNTQQTPQNKPTPPAAEDISPKIDVLDMDQVGGILADRIESEMQPMVASMDKMIARAEQQKEQPVNVNVESPPMDINITVQQPEKKTRTKKIKVSRDDKGRMTGAVVMEDE